MGNRLTQGAENPRRPLPTCGRYVGRIGALAVAMGVGAAVVAMPLAAADSGEGDSAAVSAGQPDTGGRTARTATQARTAQRGAAARAAYSAASTPRAAATETGSPRDVAAETSPAAATERARTGAGRGTAQRRPTTITADATSLSQASRPAAVIDPAAAPLDVSSVTPLSTDRAEGAVWSCRECRNPAGTSAARPVAAPTEQTLTGPGFAVQLLLDAVGTWLSGLPSGPVTDLLAGALLMVRRELFNQTPTVAPRVLVGDALRPMAPTEGSTFSTSLTGEVVGTLGATDPEGAVLSYAVSQAPQFGTVRIDPNGSWTYTPTDPAAALADVFTVSVSDGGWNILDPFAAPTAVTVAVRPGLSSSANKPGLIASDWLQIVKRSGEYLGDEPVMMTVLMTTTLGVPDSTNVWMVDKFPNQIGSSLTVGDKVPIPNEDGDAWINYSDKFKPLEIGTVADSVLDNSIPLKIPLILGLTVMFEGDFSPSVTYLNLYKQLIESDLRTIGDELGKTEIKIVKKGDKIDPEVVASALADAQRRIADSINSGTSLIIGAAVERFRQWLFAGGDPDDPVGLGVNALIPVGESMLAPVPLDGWGDSSLLALIKNRQVCAGAFSCNVEAINVTAGGYDYTEPPAVRITSVDNNGSGATARPVMQPHPVEPELEDIVAGVEVTNRGSGYTSPPKVEFDSNSGSGAEAVAVLGGGLMLNDKYLGLVTKEVRNALFDTNIPIRYGFLMPPGTVNGGIQGWETTYAGDYADNAWTEYKVETQGWSRINW